MKDYYEDLWERLPSQLTPPDVDRRRQLLLRELQPGDRVLDLGCGTGAFSAIASGAGARVVGADVAEAALSRARTAHPQLAFELVEFAGPLPFGDGEFDLVWVSEVIEHVADTAQWLSEVRRVLRPGGRLMITTPAHGRLRLLLGGIERYSPPLGDHLHLYSAGSLRTLLAEFGFRDVSLRLTGGWPLMRHSLHARAVR